MAIDPVGDFKRIIANRNKKKEEDNAKFFAQPLPLKIIDICFAIAVFATTIYLIEKRIWPASIFLDNHPSFTGGVSKIAWLETSLASAVPFVPVRYLLRRWYKKNQVI